MDEQTKQLAMALIKHFEGCRLTSYQDSVGVWTIGYGTTSGVKEGDVITYEDAERMLYVHMLECLDCIEHYVDQYFEPHETAALISLIYNIGCGAFRGSQICRLLNEGNMEAAAQQFQWWRKAGGKVLPGLVKRREAERRLFETGQIVL